VSAGGRRRLSADDRIVWETVTRAVKPLKRRVSTSLDIVIEAAPPKPGPPKPMARTKAAAAPPVAKPVPRPPTPLAPLERRAKKKLARGSQPIDGRLDLHGLTQSEAHHALVHFLHSAQARGARYVIVITGKGARSGEGERGVLRRQVPMWLRLPDFRECVVGFEEAHVGHGGEGALYVQVRRRRE
jgi:DNA-nicking Smr family endonuclease